MKRSRLIVVAISLLIILALANLGLAAYAYFDEGKLNMASVAIGILMFAGAIAVMARSKRKSM